MAGTVAATGIFLLVSRETGGYYAVGVENIEKFSIDLQFVHNFVTLD